MVGASRKVEGREKTVNEMQDSGPASLDTGLKGFRKGYRPHGHNSELKGYSELR